MALKIFNLVFTTLTVLWFMQIFPKHMAATNADRYLKVFRAALFPVVEFVRVIGISWPAEKTAQAVQNRLDWHPEPTLETAPSRRRGVPGRRLGRPDPGDGRAGQRPPEQ